MADETKIIHINMGNTAAWAAQVRNLDQGEPGFNTETNEFFVGDGVSSTANLPKTKIGETFYQLPMGGIPLGDLDDSLKADITNAIQSELDPTVPEWAKKSVKPTYTAAEVGAAAVEDLATANSRIDSLETLGHFVGNFATYADLPTNTSGFSVITINDFATISNDENYSGAMTRYIASVIDTGTGNITWLYSSSLTSSGGSVDITGKADKIVAPVENNFLSMDASGNLKDSGFSVVTLPHNNLRQLDLYLPGEFAKTITNSALHDIAYDYSKWNLEPATIKKIEVRSILGDSGVTPCQVQLVVGGVKVGTPLQCMSSSWNSVEPIGISVATGTDLEIAVTNIGSNGDSEALRLIITLELE